MRNATKATLAVGLVAVVVLFAVAASGSSSSATVLRLTDNERARVEAAGGTAHVFLLYDRRTSPNPVGRAALVCTDLRGSLGIYPEAAKRCAGTYSVTGIGTIEVAGIAVVPLDYTLAVTGGTGKYRTARGSLHVSFIAPMPLRELLVFTLAP